MFLENEDSIYAYQTEQLLTKRTEVVINDNDLNAGNGKKSRYSKRNKRSRSKSVTIRKGDTLSEIAKRNGTTVAKLKRLNKISGSNIRAGKKIRVR
jgi:membrane-bound lytic murein transglycosylase D